MPGIKRIAWVGLLACSAGSLVLPVRAADGLRGPDDVSMASRWQPRIGFSTARPWWQSAAPEDADVGASRVTSLSLLGDYYFSGAMDGAKRPSGFRATSGLLWRNTSTALADLAWTRNTVAWGLPSVTAAVNLGAAALPYVGVGYTLAPTRGGWGFSADIGLVANNPSSMVKLGRLVGGTPAVDDLLRELRLSPQINLGVSYAF